MKALKLTRESSDVAPRLQFVTIPKPDVTPHHILVRVRASAIHPSDILNAKGGFPYTQFPRVPGRDFAGVVEEGPSHLVGQEVYGTSGDSFAFTKDGFHAEYCLVHQDEITRKPSNISFAQAATLGVPLTTAALAIERISLKPSESLLVIGANGAVGSSVVQLAEGLGAKVIKATRRGGDAEDCISTEADPEFTAVDNLTQRRGVNAVIDTVGSPALVAAALKKLAKGGRLGFMSAPKSGPRGLEIDMLACYRNDTSLHGCNSLNQSATDMARRLQQLDPLLASGALRPSDGWTEVELDNALGAYEAVIAKPSGQKFVITMGGEK
ncbi:Zinc-type alcohol dehydrogenase-like protein [Purpureocillium lavendulum]|uniref:Zinc-type alcohol dehydrogenase-like protein n=1 Tax=Purpureocillium lavendulum TaxID=1247861 RepID=A0AB34FJM6_9HYPO|nr:Zinc-type alcohol dehydrogenase-like protein [Purpureocillium lavendulum]